ncbi:hypothetical protein A3I51_03765, partial [Candidatus Gottesmanbacteria bacterium RIFCSPLOWO2_02_FULL_38_8]
MIVVDASVVLKWFRRKDEDYISNALNLLQNHLDNKEIITIPSLLFLEIANALVTKSKSSEKKIRENLQFLNKCNLKIYSFTKEDYINASILAKKHQTTVYDMLYAIVAKRNNTILVTGDENFIKKT